jgi:predicted PurR-regulated permease PerM
VPNDAARAQGMARCGRRGYATAMRRLRAARGLVLWTMGAIVLAGMALSAIYVARHVLLLVYVSALLAIGFAPAVRWIERQQVLPVGGRRLPRWLAILLIYVVILGALTGLGFLVVPALLEQARQLASHLPTYVEQIQRFLVRRGLIAQRMSVQEMVQQAPFGGDAVGTLVGTVWGVLGGVFGAFTILILTFYILVEARDLFESFVRLFPRPRRRRVREVAGTIADKVTAWLGGQLMLGAVVGVLTAIGLGLMGVPYFYVLAALAFIGEFVPYIGPILAAIPAVGVAWTVSGKLALAALIFAFAVQQLENHILVPKIMQHQMGLSAVTVIVVLLIGGALLGITGAILAVPTAAILQVLFQELVPSNGGGVQITAAPRADENVSRRAGSA